MSGTFQTSSTVGIEAVTSLIFIHLYLKKLYNRFYLRSFSLSPNHIIKLILSLNGSAEYILHSLSLKYLTSIQRHYLKSPLINMENKNNKFLSSFSLFNYEFYLENWLMDTFPDHFSFYSYFWDIKSHIKNLNNITF